MQAFHKPRHPGYEHRMEWMGLMIAVMALAGLTAGGIHSGSVPLQDRPFTLAQR